MPRVRDPNRDKAFKIYKEHNGNIDLVEIASQLNLPPGTIRGWKSKDKWEQKLNGTLQIKSERSEKNKNDKNKVLDDGTRETMLNENLTPEQRLFCIYYSKSFNAVQSYMKAYQCSYENACSHAWELWKNEEIKKEVRRLNELKRQQIAVSESDLVELHMRIAFADIGDYLEFGREAVPQWIKNNDGNYIEEIDPNTNEQKVNYYNVIKLKESANIDTQLIQEVKEGREGISIKLADKQKSLEWLSRYFLINPLDKHKIDYDNKMLEIERKKTEPEQVSSDGIKDFLKAVKPSEEDIKALFADEVTEDEENTEE